MVNEDKIITSTIALLVKDVSIQQRIVDEKEEDNENEKVAELDLNVAGPMKKEILEIISAPETEKCQDSPFPIVTKKKRPDQTFCVHYMAQKNGDQIHVNIKTNIDSIG
uniref:Uncharacterized protein n=1 Tax=Caenorhabditis japonica TaxID=281687 RepID=A0A8R1HQ42_CAEJA